MKFHHKSHNKMVTVTAVRPPARFGALVIEGKYVTKFSFGRLLSNKKGACEHQDKYTSGDIIYKGLEENIKLDIKIIVQLG